MDYPKIPLRVRTGKIKCEMCSVEYTHKTTIVDDVRVLPISEQRHHIIPRRMAVRHGDPDLLINILSCCSPCHGMAKRVDQAILVNDWIGAVIVARVIHMPLDRLRDAASAYGFYIDNLVEKMQC